MGVRLSTARIGMSVITLTSNSFQEFVKGNNRVLIDFYEKDWSSQKAALDEALRKVRSAGSEVAFGTVDASVERGLAEQYVRLKRFPQLVWFEDGKLTKYHWTHRNSKAISDFVLALDRDAVVQVASEKQAFEDYSRAIVAVTKKGSDLYKALEVVALKHLDTIAFTFIDGMANSIKWHDGDVASSSDSVLEYSGPPDSDHIEAWVKGHMIRSEPIPEGHPVYERGSLVVVGRTFEQTVLQNEKDVFMLVYASWCGFCRKFYPVWDTFARVVGHIPHLTVAKMDGELNKVDMEEFKWTAYPFVFLVKAGSKEPIIFSGNRTVANLVQFAQDHGSKSFTLDPSVSFDVEEL